MGKQLVITEKPSVANDISRALGGFQDRRDDGYLERDDMILSWSVGHILGLQEPDDIDPIYKRWLISDLPIIPPVFELKPLDRTKDRLKVLTKLIGRDDVDAVVNACDAGREGELIFREIYRWSKTGKPMKRLWLNSMTPDAIREGFRSLQDGARYDGLGDAATCRSESDWLIGMNATRGITRRLRGAKSKGGDVWSAGRVQTPTLAILVDQELRVLAHEPRPYWEIKAIFAASDHQYEAAWFSNEKRGDDVRDTWILDKQQAEAILQKITGNNGSASETRKPSRESPHPLFDLTSLQREANRRFGFTAKRTSAAAQRLYEQHKALTYPRTDSRCLPEDYVGHVENSVRMLSGIPAYKAAAEYLIKNGRENDKRIFNNAGVSDHFAIVPTGEVPSGEFGGDDRRIYDLVVRRFLAAFHPAAVWERVERTTTVEGEPFRTRARTLQFAGWLSVFDREPEADEQKLPPLKPGQESTSGVTVGSQNFEIAENQTRPPARINEARLLSLMEHAGHDIEDEDLSAALGDKGLGTPATRADVVENLVTKGYVVRSDRVLRATAKGIRLIDVLRRIDAGQLASAELTGEMEKELRQVEHGKSTRAKFMRDMIEYTQQFVEKLKTFEYDDLFGKEQPVGNCPRHTQTALKEFLWGYRCPEEGCTFIIWKETNGRYIDRKTAGKLLRDGAVDVEGFLTRDGREYKATLAINEQLAVEMVGRAAPASLARDGAPEQLMVETPMSPCPFGKPCTGVMETNARFVCHKLTANPKDEESCGFTLPRTICQREMTREEAEVYLRDKKLPQIDDFVSKKGKNFGAVLFLKDSGRHGFEFLNSWNKGGGRGGAKAAAPGKKKAPARKKAAARKKKGGEDK